MVSLKGKCIIWLSHLFLDIDPRNKNIYPHKDLCREELSGFIYYGPKLETVQSSMCTPTQQNTAQQSEYKLHMTCVIHKEQTSK